MRLWWTICAAELRRGWLIRKRYPLDLLFSMAGGMIFLVTVAAGAMMILGGRMALDASWAPRIWGLVLAGVAGAALSGGIGYINQHTYAGTMEQVALSPVPLPGLVVLRQVTALLTNTPYFVAYLIGLKFFFPGGTAVAPLVVSLLVTYFGMMGAGLFMAGLAVLFQQVQSVLGFVTMAFYPLPLLASSTLMAVRVWSYFPYGLGLQVAMGTPVSWAWLVFEPLGFLVLGYWFLRWADGSARRRGVLAQY